MTTLATFVCFILWSLSRAEKGTVVSLNYPENYPHNVDENRTTIIASNKDDILEIRFLEFKVQGSMTTFSCGSCGCWDWVKIEDGDGSTLLDKTCGTDEPRPVVSNTNKAVIIFHSDSWKPLKGYKIEWESKPKDAVVDGGWSKWGSWSICDVHTGKKNRRRNCNNPTPRNDGAPCPGDSDDEAPCAVDGGWSKWGPWSICDEQTGKKNRTRECNNPTPQNDGAPCSGNANEEAFCGIRGTIVSLNYPKNYPHNVAENRTTIIAQNKDKILEIEILKLNVEGHSPCPYDWLKIEDEDGSTLLDKTCGTDEPKPVRSNTDTAVIIFHSDGSVAFEGYKIHWESKPKAIDGGWSKWEPWSICDEQTGKKNRTRKCNNPTPQNDGAPCPGDSYWEGSCTGAECSCGLANKKKTNNRISGGDVTIPNEYPWMVRIIGCGNCGGALVSPKVVLSALHCGQPTSDCPKYALLGMHKKNDEEDKIPIIQALYPSYRQYNNKYNWHDFQMYVLAREAVYTYKVSPICLPQPNAEFEGLQATAAGWGRTNKPSISIKQSPVLKSVDLTVSGLWQPYTDKYNLMIGTKVEMKDGVYQDPCSGDSGGPLMFYNDTISKYVLIGTVFGNGYDCDTDTVSTPEGVWNRVSAHMEWIQEKMEELGECMCMGEKVCM